MNHNWPTFDSRETCEVNDYSCHLLKLSRSETCINFCRKVPQ